MRLFLEQKPKNNAYQILDENKTILYTYTTKNGLGKTYTLFNENKKEVGKVKRCLFSKTLYKLYMNNKIVDKIIKYADTPLKKHQLINSAWYIESDITYSQYNVYTKDKIKVLSVSVSIATEPFHWELEVIDKKNIDLCLLTFLAITNLFTKISE